MQKLRFVNKEGVEVRLPPGFRFQPTDEELVFQYLKNKLFSLPLPASSIIPEIFNIFNYDPWDLPGDLEQERFFFSIKESMYRNGSRINRTTPSGYWKGSGSNKQILPCNSSPNRNNNNNNYSQEMVGMKKTLVFYRGRGKPSMESKTDWVMHEYRLVNDGPTSAYAISSQNYANQMENWVICRIFSKKRNSRNHANEITQPYNNGMTESQTPGFYNYMMSETLRFGSNQYISSSCSSSSSSNGGIASEVYSNRADSDHEESSSSYY